MNTWFILRSGNGESGWNMALDEALLEVANNLGRPVLRFYAWKEPAATFGYFQAYQQVAEWTRLRPLIRRPTGGGLVPHDRDWTYTLVFPAGHEWHQLKAEESYRRVHEWVGQAFQRMNRATELSPQAFKEAPGRCFAGAEKFDLLWQGQKIAGAAQRRNRHGLLIQGSVQNHPAESQREEWEEAMIAHARERFGIAWEELKITGAIEERADQLDREKYSTAEYNQRR